MTNLNNSGAGSLRNGLDTAPAAGRTIVFAVSGYIPVVSDTNFNVPAKVTIAGQTAPGAGVGLRGGRMLISGNNVVMRHFRIRHGKNGTGGDCLNIAATAHTTMLDHISMMFSTDENFSFFSSAINNYTMQYSNTAWGMERHNAGGLWDLQNGSCHHTLWAHHRTRNPKARPYGLLEWVNNVTFHWRNEGFIMGDSQTPANWKANVRGCYYIAIDDADAGSTLNSTALTKATVASNGQPNFSLHLDDTLYDYDGDGILDGTDRGYAIVAGSEFQSGDPVGANRYAKSATPFAGPTGAAAVTVDDPLTAYKKVLSSAAPLRLDANYTGTLRDELDTLLVDTVVDQYSILVQKDGKVAGEDPNRPNNGEQLLADQYGITNNGFGTLNGTTPPTDSDLDGMPDVWETALNGDNGIAYNVAADDHNTAFTAGQLPSTFFPSGTPTGYTLLEEYLHFKAIPHATTAKNSVGSPSLQTIDLRKFTDGFSSSPVFVLSGVHGGTVQQFLADGTTPAANGPIVKFTPTLDHVGRAGFDFAVTDAAGSTWTQQFALLVTSSSVPRDLVWIGGNATNAWDTSTANWQTTAGAATAFADGDTTLFDDRGSTSPAVHLEGPRVVSSMTVTGTKNYTFTGPGTLASTGSLTKAGDTTLALSTAMTFSGGSGTFLRGRQSGSGATETTYVIGALGTSTTFSGAIQNGGDSLVHIRKTGAGTWTLGGTSSYAGTLGVDQGKVLLTGSLTCTAGAYAATGAEIMLQGGTLAPGTLDIAAGAQLTGHGTLNGELVNSGTVITTTGQTLTVTGQVTNNGYMRISHGGTLVANGAFVNYGVLDVLTAGGTLPPNLENHGVIIDSGGLKVLTAAIAGANFELTIMTYTGHSYQLQASDSLTSGSWTNIGAPVSGTGNQATFQHTGGASGPRRFYRVQVD